MVQNYANSLEETNDDLRDELKQALFEKHRATSLTVNAKQLASNRLDKWHIERDRRRAAENEVARLNKSAMEMDLIIKGYRSEIEQSGKSTRCLKKEWANEEAAVAHGGARRWPPWVVQVICELLVNGTSPSAVPTAMQTMYQMLTGDTPNELPTINFVRSCRVVVEVIGETIAAMKLADAPSWNQLWTDGTTRRQIPFTALVIGLMGEDDDIDPVVVSSCIFMEDERSDTQADGIINRVNTNACDQCACFFRMINTNNLFVYSDTLFKEQVDKASRCHAYTFSRKITSCAIPCWDRHLQAWRWRCDYDRHMQYSSKSQAHHCQSDRRYL
jgi:hypothetical protein